MLIVLTSEKALTNEAKLLNQLFDNGLEVLHLRKPSFDIDDYRELLNKIDDQHLSKIMIHQFHELCLEYNLKGIHLQEQPRIDLGRGLEKYVNRWKTKDEGLKKLFQPSTSNLQPKESNNQQLATGNYTVSSSFHEPEELEACEFEFDYHLLSPVFSSISKQGYEGRGFDVNYIDKTIIGMGGVNAETIPKILELGYKGIGVLGGIWNTDNPVESFKEINTIYSKIIRR